MIATRFALVGAGALVGALVLWAVRTGWYPSRGERISRTANPVAFWSVMGVSGAAALVLICVGLFAR